MEEKNEQYIESQSISNENIDNLSNNEIKDQDLSKSLNKIDDSLFIADEIKEIRTNNIEQKNKTEIQQEIKPKDDSIKAEQKDNKDSGKSIEGELNIRDLNIKNELNNNEPTKIDIKADLNTKEDNTKPNIVKTVVNSDVSKGVIKEKLEEGKQDNSINITKSSENKVTDKNLDKKEVSIEKSTENVKKNLDIKTKVKPKKEVPIEKKPFIEFINEHLLPEIKNEFENKGKVINVINMEKTNRPISEDICWVIYCEVQETCNFWLSFEKDDITSPKSFSLCKNYEKPSIIESFLIDEKKITLKLIISRILQRLNGQKLIGAN